MSVEAVGQTLVDRTQPLKDRFRALFTLRNLGGNQAVDFIASCFTDESALLKHELAYCLGQMQNRYAIPKLTDVLEDKSQEAMVRHEAGEALAAIGDMSVLDLLKTYCNDPVIEVAETCQLAVKRLEWLSHKETEEKDLPPNPFQSIDPAPPTSTVDIVELTKQLLDEKLSLFDRYRAMFTLRNLNNTESVLALAKGLKCSSALFRHEIAYVLGQLQHDACVQQLAENLRDHNESSMVRHECAEALGSIANDESTKILSEYLKDQERVVRESCIVALDMSEYENSDQFQYADTYSKLSKDDSVKGEQTTLQS